MMPPLVVYMMAPKLRNIRRTNLKRHSIQEYHHRPLMVNHPFTASQHRPSPANHHQPFTRWIPAMAKLLYHTKLAPMSNISSKELLRSVDPWEVADGTQSASATCS